MLFLFAIRWAARVPRGRMMATEVGVREAASKLVKVPHSSPAKMTTGILD